MGVERHFEQAKPQGTVAYETRAAPRKHCALLLVSKLFEKLFSQCRVKWKKQQEASKARVQAHRTV